MVGNQVKLNHKKGDSGWRILGVRVGSSIWGYGDRGVYQYNVAVEHHKRIRVIIHILT